MKRQPALPALLLASLFLSVLLSSNVVPAAGPAAADFPAVEGWALATEVTAKSPDTLWEYINGADESFLSYGFKDLRYADLKAGETVVTVEIYDMGAPINAFGIYTTERSDDAEKMAIGSEAALALPYQCLMLKDRHYLKLNLFQGELKKKTATALLEALAAALPGSDGWPPELGLLPEKGQVAGSVSYTREAYLGMSVLTRSVHAEYADGGKPYERFTLLAGTAEERQAVWEKLAAGWMATELKGRPVLWREIPYQGISGTIFTDEGIFGVSNCSGEKEMLKRLRVFLR